MQPVPDTGGGVSGFLAHLLWYVYRYFPFEGTWDWLLLLLLLNLGLRLSSLRVLELCVGWVSRRVTSHEDRPESLLPYFAWDVSWIYVFQWFFHSAAGRTFLEGRQFSGTMLFTKIDPQVHAVVLTCWILFALLNLIVLPLGFGLWCRLSFPDENPPGFKILFVTTVTTGIYTFLAILPFDYYRSLASVILGSVFVLMTYSVGPAVFVAVRRQWRRGA